MALGELVVREALEREQLRELVVDLGIFAAAQRGRGHGIGAGRATEAEIDAPGIQRLERAEDLDDAQRRVVRDHDPPAPTRMREVAAATAAIMTSGADAAMLAMLWCSATQ